MQRYQCNTCQAEITDADKAWDLAHEIGRCPSCQTELSPFAAQMFPRHRARPDTSDNRTSHRAETPTQCARPDRLNRL